MSLNMPENLQVWWIFANTRILLYTFYINFKLYIVVDTRNNKRAIIVTAIFEYFYFSCCKRGLLSKPGDILFVNVRRVFLEIFRGMFINNIVVVTLVELAKLRVETRIILKYASTRNIQTLNLNSVYGETYLRVYLGAQHEQPEKTLNIFET